MYNLWYFVAFYTVLLEICFFFADLRCFVAKSVSAIYALLCGENLAKSGARGEKMTNIRYGQHNTNREEEHILLQKTHL